MIIQKIKEKINNLSKKRKKNQSRQRLILNTVNHSPFVKKRRSFVIKNNHLEKLKVFGNNITNYYIFILIVLIGLILYIIIGPLFKIKNIEIIKQDNITNMTISYKAVEDYRGESIWNAEKKDILKRLQNYQQNIRDIKVNILLPNTLKIIIDSYKGVFNTNINNKNYIITENGTLIPSSFSTDLKELIIKNNFDKSKFLDYKKVLDSKYIAKIYSTIKLLEDNLINIKIKEINYYVVERELHIKTENNTILIFDLEIDTKLQIEKLAIFNKEQLDINKNNIIYIDLRINNKIFYCTSENEYQCKKNIKSVYPE